MAVEDAHREEEERKRELMAKQDEADNVLRRMVAERRTRRMIKNEKVKMQRMQRTLAVERKARIDEFRRIEIEEHLKQETRSSRTN